MLTDRYKQALQFAADVHEGQTKKGSGVAYLSHLLSVSALVIENDGDEDEAIAGLLHDSVEDRGDEYVREKDFAYAKVDGFASPCLLRGDGKTYLFVGRQDGKISVFTSNPRYWGNPVFYPDDFLEGVQVFNHSCPAAVEIRGFIELTIGDYNGNLKHFACRREERVIKEN